MSEFTFLSYDQVFGGDKLDIIKKYGIDAEITDFSVLLGGETSMVGEYGCLTENYGIWWLKTIYDSFDEVTNIFVVDGIFSTDRAYIHNFDVGARPAIPYSLISSKSYNKVKVEKGILEVEYGEYPQTIVSESYSKELAEAYNSGNIHETGKYYTTDLDDHHYNDGFIERRNIEYEYNGSKYVRYEGNLNCSGNFLSDGRVIELDDIYWIKVEPITWIIDEKNDLALSKKILFAGVQFDEKDEYNDDFENTNIKRFMNICFSKEIDPDYIQKMNILSYDDKENSKKENLYGFDFEKVTEEDIIKGAVESNIPVFLHGKSSEGKSARVEQLDPDCEIIYLSNATPDSLNGKSVYNSSTGEMIDVEPTWYKKVKERCEKEPNKIHIIFFDELTNALPSIQGMAFNIVLKKEVNGKWKLPENARIVAAGNDLEDSIAANKMAEPLFNRFAHVYINTTLDSWIKWASTPKEKYERLDYNEEDIERKIHPSIYAYIAYKSYRDKNVLRTPYTGDKPNADPRKWEMASKVLYKTSKPEMLRSLIGKDLTKDFTAFTKEQVITIEDVINNNYSDNDLIMNISQKFATAVGLSSVSEEHFETVREFMKKLGAEPRAAFESMWANGDEKRLEYIYEIQMEENLLQEGIKKCKKID